MGGMGHGFGYYTLLLHLAEWIPDQALQAISWDSQGGPAITFSIYPNGEGLE